MEQYRIWTIGTFCWLFLLFNIERMFDVINLASFVYPLASLLGVVVLFSYTVRHWPFMRMVIICVFSLVIGKLSFGYALEIEALPITLLEAAALIITVLLCRQIGLSTDDFRSSANQILQVLKTCQVRDISDGQGDMLEEIRRARRHERPLSFVAFTPGRKRMPDLEKLIERLETMLEREYVFGCVGDILTTKTKSHDQITQIQDKFLMLLPETDKAGANSMVDRLESMIAFELGIDIESEIYEFGKDELTLAGVLDRVKGTNSDGRETWMFPDSKSSSKSQSE